MIHESERILEDDYPVYLGYWYLADGEPRQFDAGFSGCVEQLRKQWKCQEIRNCDLGARGMIDKCV